MGLDENGDFGELSPALGGHIRHCPFTGFMLVVLHAFGGSAMLT